MKTFDADTAVAGNMHCNIQHAPQGIFHFKAFRVADGFISEFDLSKIAHVSSAETK